MSQVELNKIQNASGSLDDQVTAVENRLKALEKSVARTAERVERLVALDRLGLALDYAANGIKSCCQSIFTKCANAISSVGHVAGRLLCVRNAFDLDLDFISQVIRENHPGMCNSLDPDFSHKLDGYFSAAKQELRQAASDKERADILQRFGKQFEDAHLWVKYDQKEDSFSSKPVAKNMRPFEMRELQKDVFWISLPTFAPPKEQVEKLRQIIHEMPQLRGKTIIFDVRGNGGGNSAWGSQLLRALFGTDYVNSRLAEANQKVFAEWRVSPGNLEHMQGLIPILKKEFEEGHPALQWAEQTVTGMKEALLKGLSYYSERPENSPTGSNGDTFQGQVFAIIDGGCGSACLDFLDGLKAMGVDSRFIGQQTGKDSLYMELRTVSLPSGQGKVGFPIKVYRNRTRGHNVSHVPDISYTDSLQSPKLQEFVLRLCAHKRLA